MNMCGLFNIPKNRRSVRTGRDDVPYPRVRVKLSKYSHKWYVIYYNRWKVGVAIRTQLTYNEAEQIALCVRQSIIATCKPFPEENEARQ